jgi:alanyl-tRNA synthetase
VEATTGLTALAMINAQLEEFREVQRALRAQPGAGMAVKAAVNMLEEKKTLEKEISRLRSKLLSGQGGDLSSQAIEVKVKDGQVMRVLAVTLDDADPKTMRETVDRLKDKLKSAAIVLGAVNDGKVSLIAGVTADLTGKVKAGELVNYVAQQVGGKGGGRPDMAQAGGTNPAGLPGALQSVKSWVESRVLQ